MAALRIAVDAMGGDSAPSATVEGAVRAARELREPPRILLVGRVPAIEEQLRRMGWQPKGIEVLPADDVIEMGEHPGKAMKSKRGSSLRVCFELMKKGDADAVVSAGNSGAMLAGAILVSGRLPRVERPAIGAVLPSVHGRTLLLDAGANTECKPVHLVQFGLMGEVYARRVLGIERPRVGVLSNGEEATKGTDLTRATAEALSRWGSDQFKGYLEGKDLFNGSADVAVCDGFTGNLLLKATEGAAQAIVAGLKASLTGSMVAAAGMLLARGALNRFRDTIDWEAVGGAPLIGIRGVAIVAHGRSTPKAILNAIRVAAEAAAVGMSHELSAAAKLGAELVGA